MDAPADPHVGLRSESTSGLAGGAAEAHLNGNGAHAHLNGHRTHVGIGGRVLVLNASYEPINVCNIRRATVLVLKERAEILERGEGALHSERLTFERPCVIRLVRYVRVPRDVHRRKRSHQPPVPLVRHERHRAGLGDGEVHPGNPDVGAQKGVAEHASGEPGERGRVVGKPLAVTRAEELGDLRAGLVHCRGRDM